MSRPTEQLSAEVVDGEEDGPAGQILTEVGRIVGFEALGSELTAKQTAEAGLERIGVVPAPVDGDIVGYAPSAAQETDEHQTALDEAALSAVAAGPVHPHGSIEDLLIHGDIEGPPKGVERRDRAVEVLGPVGVVNPGANVVSTVHRLIPRSPT